MAISKLKKLTLVGANSSRQSVFDALIATRVVHIAQYQDIDNCHAVADEGALQDILSLSSRMSESISYLSETCKNYNNANKKKPNYKEIVFPKPSMSKPFVEISYQDFVASGDKLSDMECVVSSIERDRQSITRHHNQIEKITEELNALKLYGNLPNAINSYCDTENAFVQLGTIANNSLKALTTLIDDNELAELTVIDSNQQDSLVLVVVHKSLPALLTDISATGFVKTSFNIDMPVKQYMLALQKTIRDTRKVIDNETNSVLDNVKHVASLRLAIDYLAVAVEKQELINKMPTTESAFIIQAYVPSDNVKLVTDAVSNVTDSCDLYYEDAEADDAPVLYKNNSYVRSFEVVTDMYSSPKYSELDPNPMLSIFYFIIFGLMVADMGYGLVLIILGIFSKFAIKQNTGIKKLISLFGICGLSAVVIGTLYGTFFGFIMYDGILPDTSKYPTTTMVICLMFGLLHIMAGYLMDSAYKFRTKQGGAGFVSLLWSLFFLALVPALLQSAIAFMDYDKFSSYVLPTIVGEVGLYAALGTLGLAVLLSAVTGGKRPFMSRITSSLGSVYSLLNLFGDVMSYIRIFGLMLSSAMVGMVINDMAVGMMSGSVGGTIAGVVLIIFGHVFNIAISLLSVYIHNGRLQYVEFFGKFYQGDGQLFAPFGSNTQYTLIK